MTDQLLRKEKRYCEYCNSNLTTRIVRAEDGADYPCCKECYIELRRGDWD